MHEDHDGLRGRTLRVVEEGLETLWCRSVKGGSPSGFSSSGKRHVPDATGGAPSLGRPERDVHLLDWTIMSSSHHVIVDGSNLATEGRSVPSLTQLDDAVQAYRLEDPNAQIVVVVDATFGHRIDPGEKATFDEAIDHGELLTPPAGAIGRGDGFILKIADKVGAIILSNDSFQEFHGDYPWLFDEGRLIGGKPVPTIGWIFTPRSPVRGLKSRQSASKAKPRLGAVKKLTVTLPDGIKPSIGDAITPPIKPTRRVSKKQAPQTLEVVAPLDVEPEAGMPLPVKKRAARTKVAPKADVEAEVTPKKPARRASKSVDVPAVTGPVEAVEAAAPKKRASRKMATTARVESEPPKTPVLKRSAKKVVSPPQASQLPARPATSPANEPLAFVTFISTYPLESVVEGSVSSFTSHGAMIAVVLPDGTSMVCYAPTKHLSEPPPKSAKEVLVNGETYSFRVRKLDPARRVAELSFA